MSILKPNFLRAIKNNRALLLALSLAMTAAPAYASNSGFSSLSDYTPYSGTYSVTVGTSTTQTTGTVFGTTASIKTANFYGPVGIGVGSGTALPSNGLVVVGSVGIGTSSPNTGLEVMRSTLDSNDIIRMGFSNSAYGSSGYDYFAFARNMSTGTLTLQGNQTGTNNIALAPTSGLVAIGTTSSASALSVSGGVAIGTGYVTTAAPANGAIIQGQVGIGTSAVWNSTVALAVWGPMLSYNTNYPDTGTYITTDNLPGGNWLVSASNNRAWFGIGTEDDEPINFEVGGFGTGQWVGAFKTDAGFVIGPNLGQSPTAGYSIGTSAITSANGTVVNYTPYLLVEGNAYIAGSVTAASVTATTVTQTSDQRLKTDIHPISNSLDKLLSLHGVEFSWKKDGRGDMGVVAQDVQKVFPNVVLTGQDKDGTLSVEYNALIGPTIEAIRQLKTENDDMKAQMIEMNAEIKALKENRLHSIKADKADGVILPSNAVEH